TFLVLGGCSAKNEGTTALKDLRGDSGTPMGDVDASDASAHDGSSDAGFNDAGADGTIVDADASDDANDAADSADGSHPDAGFVTYRTGDGHFLRVRAVANAIPEDLTAALDAISAGQDTSVNPSP